MTASTKEYEYVPARMMGCCPTCAGFSWRINNGQDHWGVCTKHKTKWLIGSDLWGDWREPTSEKGLKLLASCHEVEFVRPDDPYPSKEDCERHEIEHEWEIEMGLNKKENVK